MNYVDPSSVRVLSMYQPWAWAVLYAGKDIENRDWPTHYRGRFLIHAARAMTEATYDQAFDQIDRVMGGTKDDSMRRRARFLNSEGFRGGIVGSVELVDCVQQSDSPWFFGKYGFVLRNPKPIEFFPCNGNRKWFRPPAGFDLDQVAA